MTRTTSNISTTTSNATSSGSSGNFVINNNSSSNNASVLLQTNDSKYHGLSVKNSDKKIYVVKNESDKDNLTYTNSIDIDNLNTQVVNNTTDIGNLSLQTSTNTLAIAGNTSSINSINSKINTTTVKVGINSGISAGSNSVSIGNGSGQSAGPYSVNIGSGSQCLGDTGICIGQNSKSNLNSAIVLNGMGTILSASYNSLYCDPIRNDTSNSNVLTYNNTTKEVNQNSTLYSGLDTRITNNNNSISTLNTNITNLQFQTNTNTSSITAINNRVNNSRIKLGYDPGAYNQSDLAIAIGYNAGYTEQGQYAIAIGHSAGKTNQHSNSLIITADGNTTLNSGGSYRTYIAPIRNDTNNYNILTYNASSKEINSNNLLYTELDSRINTNTTNISTLTTANNTNSTNITNINNKINNGFTSLVKGTYNAGYTGWDNYQFDASPSAGSAYVRVNRATNTSGEVGFTWANGGTNQWINYIPSNSSTLTWFNQTGGQVMKLDLSGALTLSNNLILNGITQDNTQTTFLTYNTTSKQVNYNSTAFSDLNNNITNVNSSLLTLQSNYDKTKAYAFVSFNAVSQTITNSFKVSSITYSSAGVFRVNFVTNTFPNANYIALATSNKSETFGDDGNSVTSLGNEQSGREFTSTSVPVNVVYRNTGTPYNPTRCNVICFYNNPNL